jgi:hypothetical protein
LQSITPQNARIEVKEKPPRAEPRDDSTNNRTLSEKSSAKNTCRPEKGGL